MNPYHPSQSQRGLAGLSELSDGLLSLLLDGSERQNDSFSSMADIQSGANGRSRDGSYAGSRTYDSIFEGDVVHGAKLGRTIGFPTANIEPNKKGPPRGIYASRVRIDAGPALPAVAYFGDRPTVNGAGDLLEVFIFNFDSLIYGAQLVVSLVRFIRPELVFDDMNSMKLQIARDCEAARKVLGC